MRHIFNTILAVLALASFAGAQTTRPTYYANSQTGNDLADGSAVHPWKSIRVVDNATVLAAGTFHQTISFGDHTNAIVDGQSKTIIDSDYCSQWANSKGCNLANVTLTSDDGNGYAGQVSGTGNSLVNDKLDNLNEGFHLNGTINEVVMDLNQIGKVKGRCLMRLGSVNTQWAGGRVGPASTQSPVRDSSLLMPDGTYAINVGGFIKGVYITQVGSPFPIACGAFHADKDVQFIDVTVDGGEFSADSAGEGDGDCFIGCTITNLTTINTKLSLHDIANSTKVVGGSFLNPTGECVSLSCAAKAGNTITGVKMNSPKHGVHFYTANDTKISQVTLVAPAKTPVMDGAVSQGNDGGGNVVDAK